MKGVFYSNGSFSKITQIVMSLTVKWKFKKDAMMKLISTAVEFLQKLLPVDFVHWLVTSCEYWDRYRLS